MSALPADATIRRYATAAGILGLVSFVAGGFGEAYVPSLLIVADKPEVTAANVVASQQLFRWGFAGYLLEALADASLTLLFFLLLRVVRTDLALLAVFYRLLGTAGFAMAQVLTFAALSFVTHSGMLASPARAELNDIVWLLVDLSRSAQSVFTMFYGMGSCLIGYLIYRSGFLPQWIGALVLGSGVAFILRTFTGVLVPSYSSELLVAPAGVAWGALTIWLLVKGVDVARWREMAVLSR
jgi:hypothetical protein